MQEKAYIGTPHSTTIFHEILMKLKYTGQENKIKNNNNKKE
jgi:hypothetical protein